MMKFIKSHPLLYWFLFGNPPYRSRGHRVVMESGDFGKTWQMADYQGY